MLHWPIGINNFFRHRCGHTFIPPEQRVRMNGRADRLNIACGFSPAPFSVAVLAVTRKVASTLPAFRSGSR